MKTKNFSEISVEELQKQEKTFTFLIGFLAGLIILLLCISGYHVFNNQATSSSAFPLILLPIVMLNWNTLKQIKAELKSRNVA